MKNFVVVRTLSIVAALLALGLAGCGGALAGAAADTPVGDSSFEIQNTSHFLIKEIRLAAVSSNDWGDNLLGADVLRPTESLTITNIECGEYDVMLIDEDGDTCNLTDLSLCFDDAAWVLSDVELAVCQF